MDRDELVREVYAHFGLALYNAQVLEHGLANGMVFACKAAGRLPTVADFDNLLGSHFERTLGGLIRELRNHLSVKQPLAELLKSALTQRNWLAHRYFRERAATFMTERGCTSMIEELQAAQELFSRADAALAEVVRPLAVQAGVTDAQLDAYVAQVILEACAGG
jgi:hypothetical protein